MNELEKKILHSASSTEPSTFREVLRGMGDDSPGNGSTWAAFFRALESLETLGYLEVDRASDNKVNSIVLTENGAAEARRLLNNA